MLGACATAPKLEEVATKDTSRTFNTVVVDAGHGGKDVGAVGAKGFEKDINLAAALALKDRLERTGRYQVVLTRDSDVYIPLETRVRIAQRANADLFISLHSDSGPDATLLQEALRALVVWQREPYVADLFSRALATSSFHETARFGDYVVYEPVPTS